LGTGFRLSPKGFFGICSKESFQAFTLIRVLNSVTFARVKMLKNLEITLKRSPKVNAPIPPDM